MAHQHQVVDSDIRFIINPATRAITRANPSKSSLVVGDHNSERFTFEIPKTVEGHDMSKCNVVRVHYLNTSADNKSVQSIGVYEVDDFASDPKDENVMKFSWLISSKATQHVGPLAFTIQFACMTGFKVDYSWQSGIFSGITVSNAVNGAEVVIEEYADILQQWRDQLFASSDLPICIMTSEEFNALDGDTNNGVLYMLSDDPILDKLDELNKLDNFDGLEKIPNIEQSISTLNTAVQTNAQRISVLNREIQTNIQYIDDLNVAVPANSRSITTLNTAVQTNTQSISALNTAVQTNTQSISDLNTDVDSLEQNVAVVQDNVESVAKKWRWAEYTKLYEYYDAELGFPNVTEVDTGLYIIRADRESGGHTFSTSIILDTYNKSYSSTSFAIPDAQGVLDYYILRSSVIDPAGVVNIVPYKIVPYISADTDGDHSISWQESIEPASDITLYGRCIYTNPMG